MTPLQEICKQDAAGITNGLAQFNGTDQWYKMLFSEATYTDGVKYFAEAAGAYWFIDIVSTEIVPLLKVHPFMNIVLKVKDNKAVILVDDGNGEAVFSKNIDYTDCPEGDWKFFLTNDVLLLPGEY